MRIAMTVLLALVVASPVTAQDRFKDVWVTQSDSGEIVRGRLVELSGSSLAILTPDNRRVEMPIDKVLRIEAHGDSLKNGALIGAAVMGGMTILACQGFTGGSQCLVGIAFNTGFGALIGMGIDAANGGRSTLYRRAPPAKTAGIGFRLRF
jgi:hypothetical protein